MHPPLKNGTVQKSLENPTCRTHKIEALGLHSRLARVRERENAVEHEKPNDINTHENNSSDS
jgi:hypothetical protein